MERRAVTVRGMVQGVGFRPYVYLLASRWGLNGFVRNESGLVRIEVEGDRPALERFCRELTDRPPPLALIEQVDWEPLGCRGEVDFRIADSTAGGSGEVVVSPDVATCDDCLGELFDPADRRFRYPFLNCTACGPRLTIVRRPPTIGPVRRWPNSRCASTAGGSTTTRTTGDFTPSRPAARAAVRSCGC